MTGNALILALTTLFRTVKAALPSHDVVVLLQVGNEVVEFTPVDVRSTERGTEIVIKRKIT